MIFVVLYGLRKARNKTVPFSLTHYLKNHDISVDVASSNACWKSDQLVTLQMFF
jgi:hypothetical protein